MERNKNAIFCFIYFLQLVKRSLSIFLSVKDKRDAILEEAKSLIDAQEDPK